MSKPDASQLADIVAQAEKAVAGVKDEELRKVAFAKILDTLLGTGPHVPTQAASNAKAKGGKRSRRSDPEKSVKKPSIVQYIQDLAAEDYFKEQRSISEVEKALGEAGHHISLTSLSGPLQKLCQDKVLRRKLGPKGTYLYSNR